MRPGMSFPATPSDVSYDTPVIPGTGLCPSSRGSQSWADPAHPSGVAPGKRPRLTPNPAMAVFDDGSVMAFGTPGGDVQVQAMLQAWLNLTLFGMEPQTAIEAPASPPTASQIPSSRMPHSPAGSTWRAGSQRRRPRPFAALATKSNPGPTVPSGAPAQCASPARTPTVRWRRLPTPDGRPTRLGGRRADLAASKRTPEG